MENLTLENVASYGNLRIAHANAEGKKYNDCIVGLRSNRGFNWLGLSGANWSHAFLAGLIALYSDHVLSNSNSNIGARSMEN